VSWRGGYTEEMHQELISKIDSLITKIDSLLSRLDVDLSTRASEYTLTIVSEKVRELRDKVKAGVAFSSSARAKGVASDGSVGFLLQNPSGSGKTVDIVVVEIVGKAEADIDIYKDPTITASGTSMVITNLNFAYPDNATVCSAEYGGTYDTSGAVKKLETVLPGGSGVRAIGSISEVGEIVEIPEGHSILVVVTNTSQSSSDYSCRFVWYEE